MSKSFKKDLTGQRFGRLTVLEFVPNDKHHSYWKCKCECGNTSIICISSLISGDTKSCGCLGDEQRKKNGKETGALNGKKNIAHNKSHRRIHNEWLGIKKRCLNKNYLQYNLYGGRGITICDEWRNDFQAFYDWAMSNGYKENLTIERIDVNGNYEPSNCQWVDNKRQARNKRNNVIVSFQGEQICLAEAAERLGISYKTLWSRYNRGDRGECLFRPYGTRK